MKLDRVLTINNRTVLTLKSLERELESEDYGQRK
jgi:hypothetical protein